MPVYKVKPFLGDGGSGGADIKVIEVENITSMTDEQLNSLKAGDVVVKLTSNQKHTYTVSYKENGQGICLTYTDASVVETVSYDYTDGHWVYNSTDVTSLGGGGESLPKTYQTMDSLFDFIETAGFEIEGVGKTFLNTSKLKTLLLAKNIIDESTLVANTEDMHIDINVGHFNPGSDQYLADVCFYFTKSVSSHHIQKITFCLGGTFTGESELSELETDNTKWVDVLDEFNPIDITNTLDAYWFNIYNVYRHSSLFASVIVYTNVGDNAEPVNYVALTFEELLSCIDVANDVQP